MAVGESPENRFASRIVAVAAVFFWAIVLTMAFRPGLALAGDSLGCAEKEAKAVVHATALGLGALLKDQPDKEAGIALIRKFIAPVRFYADDSGYFYVYDMDCVNIAHATQSDLPGKNLRDHKDSKGKYVVRELAAAAQKGGGFVEFYWVKPGSQGEHRKMGYVEPIPGTDYFIGSGVYLGGK